MRGRAAFLALALLGWGLPAPAPAQTDPATAAARAAAAVQAATDKLAATGGARDRIRALTETIRAYEDGLAALRAAARQAALREAVIEARFAAEAVELGALLSVLQTMQGTPEATLLLHPGGALGTARSGLIIADVAPAVAAEAQRLRAALEDLRALRGVQTQAAETLAEGLSGLQTARVALADAAANRRDLPRRVVEDAAALQSLRDSAETLSAFAASLGALPPLASDVTLPGFAGARGNLTLPVRGTLRRGFDEADAAGISRPGWIVATDPGALVTAPWPATIRYAGPLLDYGNVIVLEPEQGYLLVLAGLGELYLTPGDIAPVGRPLGLMPRASADGAGEPVLKTLYIEIREGGAPVDPRGWFRQDKDITEQ